MLIVVSHRILELTQSCQPITSAPRIRAGEFSAAKIGTVEPANVDLNIYEPERNNSECRTFGPHSNTEDQTNNKESLPAMGKC
jgi:hypothetical protein